MADIDMIDAPSGSGSAGVKKSLGKAKAAAGEGGADGKMRFEVKKVGPQTAPQGWRVQKINVICSGTQ